jgi:hypothetical protein
MRRCARSVCEIPPRKHGSPRAPCPGEPSHNRARGGFANLKVENGLTTEQIGLDDGVSALRQLGLIAES